MTQTGYFAPAPITPCVTWKLVLTVLVAVVSVPLSFVLTIAGAITWSGCFMSCHGANHPYGALLYAAALGAVASGPVMAGFLVRSKGLLAATLAFPVCAASYVGLCLVN